MDSITGLHVPGAIVVSCSGCGDQHLCRLPACLLTNSLHSSWENVLPTAECLCVESMADAIPSVSVQNCILSEPTQGSWLMRKDTGSNVLSIHDLGEAQISWF